MISTTASTVYLTMRNRIDSAEWMTDEGLVHRHLARKFGSSNIPVVEACVGINGGGAIGNF